MYEHSALEVQDNVNSIKAVPKKLLPDGPAREALVRRARAGEDVYAYRVGIRPPYTWNVWLVNVRVEAAEYAALYR